MSKGTQPAATVMSIPAPDLRRMVVHIESTTPYVQLKFSEKAKAMMRAKMEAGSTAKSKRAKDARDFDSDFAGAQHISEEGWHGIPAAAFRSALISACRLVGFKMTLAKLSINVSADGFDRDDGTPMVRINGDSEMHISHVRNATGVVDLRVRAMFRKWTAGVTIEYDAGQFTENDVVNLLARVGLQVGVGEGRPDSKNSAGMNFGLFRVAGAEALS